MHTFEHTVEIAAPTEQVWQWSIEPTNWPQTNPSIRNLEIVEETENGYLMDITYKVLGMTFDGDIEMDMAEMGEHIHSTFTSEGMTGTMDYHFRETDAGTEVTHQVEYEFGDSLLERLMEPVATRYNARQWRHALENTREILEAEAEADAERMAAA